MAINTTKIILLVTKGNWGGAQKYVHDLATSLPKERFDVLVAYGEGEMLSQKLSEAQVFSRQIPSLARDVSIFKDFLVFWNLTKLFLAEKPDVVHLNSSKIGGLGALAGRIAGVRKIVFTVHGFAFNEDRPWIQKKIIAFLSWLTLTLSTDVICISRSEYKHASKWPFNPSRKLHLIPNGISSPAFLEKEEAKKKLLEHSGKTEEFFANKKVVISIGELTKNKGYRYAIPAFKNLGEFAYAIVGAGEEKEILEKIIDENGLSERVMLAGFVAGASSLLKAADIFLLPSIKEGLPYAIIEAGMARLPAVATAVGGIPDIIENGVSGIIVSPKNSQAIEEALAQFNSDKDFKDMCASRLEHEVNSKYNKSGMIRSTILVYNK